MHIGNVFLSLSQFLPSEYVTPNEVRAAADMLACQMEALEEENWTKAVAKKEVTELTDWVRGIEDNNLWALQVQYAKKVLSKGDFLQELDLAERKGLNLKKVTAVLVDTDSHKVVWSNKQQ